MFYISSRTTDIFCTEHITYLFFKWQESLKSIIFVTELSLRLQYLSWHVSLCVAVIKYWINLRLIRVILYKRRRWNIKRIHSDVHFYILKMRGTFWMGQHFIRLNVKVVENYWIYNLKSAWKTPVELHQ